MNAPMPGGGAGTPVTPPISRVYNGTYEDCQKALANEAAELAKAGYRVVFESYDIPWGIGACVGCLSVEFGPIVGATADIEG